MRSPQLHNVTLYVEKSALETARTFYRALFGRQPTFEERGHIVCFGTPELAICVHEEEAGHPAGSHEFFFWADDLDDIQADLADTRTSVQVAGDDELRCVDPAGNQIRVHPRRP